MLSQEDQSLKSCSVKENEEGNGDDINFTIHSFLTKKEAKTCSLPDEWIYSSQLSQST